MSRPCEKALSHIAFSAYSAFANARCKMRDARGRDRRMFEKALSYKAFLAHARRPGRGEGGLVFGSFPYAPYAAVPWQRLNFFPLPHGQSSLRPTFGCSRCSGFAGDSSSLLV